MDLGPVAIGSMRFRQKGEICILSIKFSINLYVLCCKCTTYRLYKYMNQWEYIQGPIETEINNHSLSYKVLVRLSFAFTFSHLADALIQSNLQ